jgi:hypothetical protein
MITVALAVLTLAALCCFYLDHAWRLRFKQDGSEVRLLGRVGAYPSGQLYIDDGTSTVGIRWRNEITKPTIGSIAIVTGKWKPSRRILDGSRRFTIWPGDQQ